MENIKEQLEEVIKKNLPEKRELKECGKCNACEMMMACEVLYADRQFNQALSQINTSLIADEVLKVVVETTINMLRDESMLAECITKTLGYGHHYSTMPVLRGIVSEIEKKLLSEHLSPNKENEIEEIPLFNGTMDKLNKLSIIKGYE